MITDMIVDWKNFCIMPRETFNAFKRSGKQFEVWPKNVSGLVTEVIEDLVLPATGEASQ